MKKKLTKGKIVPADPETSTNSPDWNLRDDHAAHIGRAPRQPYAGSRPVVLCYLKNSFDGLFNLWEDDDGTLTAELGSKTFHLANQLGLNHTAVESGLWAAFYLLPKALEKEMRNFPYPQIEDPEIFPEDSELGPGNTPRVVNPLRKTNIYEIHHAAVTNWNTMIEWRRILLGISDAIASDLAILRDFKGAVSQRKKAKKNINLLLRGAVDSLFLGADNQPHASSAQVLCKMEDGKERKVLLAWLILQLAPTLVQTTQALPSKKELRDYVVSRYPDAEFSDAKWTKAFKDAGLASLDRSGKW